MWDFLYERSVGCVGILRDWLMRAVITSLRNDRARLTKRTLEQTALSIAQCEKIIAEARDGETRLAESEQGQSRLRRLLNLEGPLAADRRSNTRSRLRRNRRRTLAHPVCGVHEGSGRTDAGGVCVNRCCTRLWSAADPSIPLHTHTCIGCSRSESDRRSLRA